MRRTLSASELRPRYQFLNEQKQKLAILARIHQSEAKGAVPLDDDAKPEVAQYSFAEQKIYLSYICDQVKILNHLNKYAVKVERWSEKVRARGFGVFNFAYFTGLRRMIARVDSLLARGTRMLALSEERAQAAADVHRKLGVSTRRGASESVAGLRTIFRNLGERVERISIQRNEVGKRRAELRWIDSWLEMQRIRAANERAGKPG